MLKREFLKEKGLTDEQVEYVMSEAGKELTAEKNKNTVLETERDNYKAQLETAQASLKEFEGVDVKELQGKITQLNNDLQTKETAHQQKMADMLFENELKDAITQMGGRSVKSVMAELDIETLKTSKNQKDDIKNALETCKKDHDFLFGANEPINNVNVGSTQGMPSDNNGLDELKRIMGIKETKK